MKTATQWLEEYGESHQNSTNKLIHWICVPAIFWSVALMLWSIPVPQWLAVHSIVNWATVALVLVMIFYIVTSLSLSIGMFLFSAIVIWATYAIERLAPFEPWVVGVVIFIVAWIFQFVGHKIEGKKPSFFKDVLFLLVGPAWLMGFIYKKLGIKFS
ncbi:DUF962 domain-containing protein [Pleionea sediminis]|uniref:Mpo1 family 2-hydroxy fatty acid dioxygenase n=1 Tax=Pleionea sediminis TaxID=2569479 RepID=UPI0011857CFA|nr:Mpo1-like protein [Pleionea sediminis]